MVTRIFLKKGCAVPRHEAATTWFMTRSAPSQIPEAPLQFPCCCSLVFKILTRGAIHLPAVYTPSPCTPRVYKTKSTI